MSFTNPFTTLGAGTSSSQSGTGGQEMRLLAIEKQLSIILQSLNKIQESINRLSVDFQSFKQVAVIPAADPIEHTAEKASPLMFDPFLR